MERPGSKRLVLSLYKSLQKIAAKYDKHVQSARNPLFLMQREKDAKSPNELQSVCGLVRESFKNNKGVHASKITPKIQDAFSSLKVLHQFYQPSLAWISILERKNVSFEEVLLTIAKFDTPENVAAVTQQLNHMKQRVQSHLSKDQEPAEQPTQESQLQVQDVYAGVKAESALRILIGSLEEEGSEKRQQEAHGHAKKVLDAISRVMYREMGFREVSNNVRQEKNDKADTLQLNKILLGGAAPHSILASTIIVLAQQENVQLHTCAVPGIKPLLRYSVLNDPNVCHESDIFVDPATGEVLSGLRAAKHMIDKIAKNTNREGNGTGVIIVEHKPNTSFITQMMASLALNSPNKWKEHLTVIEELTKRHESNPTQVFQFSLPSKSATKQKLSATSTKAAPTEQTPPPPASPSSPSPPSSSPSPSSAPKANLASSRSPSSAYSLLNPMRYISSFFSFFTRGNKLALTAPTPSSSTTSNSSTPSSSQETEHQEKGEKGDKKGKRGNAASAPNAGVPSNLRKYSRMFGTSSDVINKPRKF